MLSSPALRPAELAIRTALGVPDTATSVLILAMDAHLDWDWLKGFQTLALGQVGASGDASVQQIIEAAAGCLESTPAYRYSVCEMGFLRTVLAASPELLPRLRAIGGRIDTEGAGIVSPDNLLPHGEAFIRNYLLGKVWQQAALGRPMNLVYLPDDFGHDAQLPVVIEAMGRTGVSFSRVPGGPVSSSPTPVGGGPSLFTQLMAEGADFVWTAADGSSVVTHVMQNMYTQGNELKNANPDSAVELIQKYIARNKPSSPTAYMYVPCGNDFALPIGNLPGLAAGWNNQPGSESTWVTVGTLEQFVALITATGLLKRRSLDPTPYWTGHYASRPANKILHHAAVGALLGAELFGQIADLLSAADAAAWVPVQAARRAAVAQGWEAVVPSTHHDYITGTAVDAVYTGEQLPLLRAAVSVAEGARGTAIAQIAGIIGATPVAGEVPVAVFNQVGAAHTGLVELPALPGFVAKSVRSGHLAGPVQVSATGSLLFSAAAPSMGYSTCYLSAQAVTEVPKVTVTLSDDGTVTLRNACLEAQISRAEAWGLTYLASGTAGQLGPSMVPAGSVANDLLFCTESRGNLYAFGNELISTDLAPIATAKPVCSAIEVREAGPLRAHVVATVTYTIDGAQVVYTREYILEADEPFLRMATTGAAPAPNFDNQVGHSVMLRFPLASPEGSGPAVVDRVIRGTPCHWYDQLPVAYWEPPTFMATHDFVAPTVAGAPLAVFYHRDIPPWGLDERGVLLACILRNTPFNNNFGAVGSDSGSHRRVCALRVPAGAGLPPASTSALIESRSLFAPLTGAYINVPADDSGGVIAPAPTTFSLVSVAKGASALITAAKPGEVDPSSLVLRVYQPSNGSADVTLSLADYTTALGKPWGASRATALEDPLPTGAPVTASNDAVTFSMDRALTTILVKPSQATSGVKSSAS